MPLRRLNSFSFGVLCLTFEDLPIYWHDSDTMLDEHDSSQWYDIVHFEHIFDQQVNRLNFHFYQLYSKEKLE